MRATYRLQLGPGLGFDDARALVPYLRGARGQPPLPLPQPAGAPRLDARLRRHRPAVASRRTSAARRPSARWPAPGWTCCSTSSRTTWRPRDENPFWADPALRERYFDIDPRTGRHRRFFSIDELAGVRVEDPDGLRGHPRPGAAPGGGGRRGRPAHRPPGRPRRPGGYLRRLAERGVEHDLGGEDPRARRGAAGLAGGGHDGLRVHGRRHRPVHRPGRRGAADGALRASSPASGATSTSWPTRPSATRRTRPSSPRSSGCRSWWTTRTWPTPSPRCRCTAPTSSPTGRGRRRARPARGGGGRPPRARARGAGRAGRRARRRRSRCASSRPPARSWPRASRTPPSTATPAWPRSTRWAATPAAGAGRREEVHARQRRARAPLPARPARHPDPRHQALRATCARASARWPRCPSCGASGSRHWWELNAPLRARRRAHRPDEEYLIYQTLVGAWPLERERLRDYMVKAMREAKVDDRLGRARRGATRRP